LTNCNEIYYFIVGLAITRCYYYDIKIIIISIFLSVQSRLTVVVFLPTEVQFFRDSSSVSYIQYLCGGPSVEGSIICYL